MKYGGIHPSSWLGLVDGITNNPLTAGQGKR